MKDEIIVNGISFQVLLSDLFDKRSDIILSDTFFVKKVINSLYT